MFSHHWELDTKLKTIQSLDVNVASQVRRVECGIL